MIKGKLNKAVKATKAFQEYQETKTKMSKEIYAMIKGEKVVLGNVNSKKQFTFREDIDMSIVSKKTMERLEDMYETFKPKQI